MNKYITLCGLALLLTHLPLVAAEINFNPAYVLEPATNSQELTLGGVDIFLGEDDFPTPHTVKLGFNGENNEFFIIESVPQVIDGSLLQAQLQGTFWKGEYRTNTNFYFTSLRLISVENGFVGAEVVHDTGAPEQDNFLRAQLGGTIFSEYLIPNEGNNADEVPEIWITQTAYLERVAEIETANAELLAEQGNIGVNLGALELETPPPILAIRHQLRLKRILGLEFRHSSARWGSANEYRMTLENGVLTGVAGTPSDSYSRTNDGMTGNGAIDLVPAHIYDAERAPFPLLELTE